MEIKPLEGMKFLRKEQSGRFGECKVVWSTFTVVSFDSIHGRSCMNTTEWSDEITKGIIVVDLQSQYEAATKRIAELEIELTGAKSLIPKDGFTAEVMASSSIAGNSTLTILVKVGRDDGMIPAAGTMIQVY